LGLFVRIRAYSDNLLSYEYGSNVRLALNLAAVKLTTVQVTKLLL
jgi:hypothetical protein